MKMNGLNMRIYWINVYIFNLTIGIVTCFVLFCAGRYLFEVEFFLETNWLVLWLMLAGWAVAQVGLTNFIGVFINNAKSATIIGYLLSIFSTLAGQTICTFIYPFPEQMPISLLFYPPFALCRSIYLIGNACSNNSCYKSIQ
jgi:hypothetical protein